MIPERTELTWTYEPADLLEAAGQRVTPDCTLVISDGKAVASVRGGRPTGDVEARITLELRAMLRIRQLQVHRPVTVDGPSVVEFFADGHQNVSVRLKGEEIWVFAGRVDTQIADACGAIVSDSRAERIASETAELERIAAKIPHKPALEEMLESYSKAIDDPANELLYLYEVRECLKRQFRDDEGRTKRALGIQGDWGKLGQLANGPIEEGRHRGQHQNRRHATADELRWARDTVRAWIGKFANLP